MSNRAYQNIVSSDEKYQIGVDFDGVIHSNSLGFHDGTIYDELIEGSRTALEKLSKSYKIIIFTCKAKPDRVLVEGKTGTDLIWDWLRKHEMDQFVHSVTSEKPRAAFYIDDKAFRFTSWSNFFNQLALQEA